MKNAEFPVDRSITETDFDPPIEGWPISTPEQEMEIARAVFEENFANFAGRPPDNIYSRQYRPLSFKKLFAGLDPD